MLHVEFFQVATHESSVRLSGQTRRADQLAQMVTWGRAACELAPAAISKLDVASIKQRIEILQMGNHTLPYRVWLHLVTKVACTHLERESIPDFVRCILPWRTEGVSESLCVANPVLSLIPFPPDIASGTFESFVGETVFSDELARLLKQPSPAVVIELAERIIKEYVIADASPALLDGIPDAMVDPFDEVYEAMKALRAVGCAKPTVGGRKAARDIFSPDRTPSLSDNLKCLVTCCRTSPQWCSLIDNYWPTSVQTDDIAQAFSDLEKSVCSEAATLDSMIIAVEKVPSHKFHPVGPIAGRRHAVYNMLYSAPQH
jgi:hypothetical protein